MAADRRDFSRLWAGQTISVLGTAVTNLALPTIAILGMHASPFLVGLLEAASLAAYPVLGLFAGVWIDRWSRRRTMILADIVRALALASIPAAAAIHALTFVQLVIVALVASAASVFFDIAYQAFVPALVDESWLEHANARLEASSSVAMLVGSGIAGALISAIGAGLAAAVDAVSYVASIAALVGIRTREMHRDPTPAAAPAFRTSLGEGLRLVFETPVLRTILFSTASINFAWAIVNAVVLIFYYRTLHFSPALVGAIAAVGNIGFIGALAAPAIGRRISPGRILPLAVVGVIVAAAALPLATLVAPIVVIVAVQILASICVPIFNVTQVSLRQRLVPPALRGRSSAIMKTAVLGVMPLGSLIGGSLGGSIGIVPTLVTGAIVMCAALPWMLSPEIRSLNTKTATSSAAVSP